MIAIIYIHVFLNSDRLYLQYDIYEYSIERNADSRQFEMHVTLYANSTSYAMQPRFDRMEIPDITGRVRVD